MCAGSAETSSRFNDFVPSGLSLYTASEDMVHWQWTGSDYNPQRGCNDAEGGPPDGNNGNQNARADRTNVVELANMAHNYPFGGLNNEANILPILLMDPVTAAQVTFFTNSDGDEADLAMVKKNGILGPQGRVGTGRANVSHTG